MMQSGAEISHNYSSNTNLYVFGGLFQNELFSFLKSQLQFLENAQ